MTDDIDAAMERIRQAAYSSRSPDEQENVTRAELLAAEQRGAAAERAAAANRDAEDEFCSQEQPCAARIAAEARLAAVREAIEAMSCSEDYMDRISTEHAKGWNDAITMVLALFPPTEQPQAPQRMDVIDGERVWVPVLPAAETVATTRLRDAAQRAKDVLARWDGTGAALPGDVRDFLRELADSGNLPEPEQGGGVLAEDDENRCEFCCGDLMLCAHASLRDAAQRARALLEEIGPAYGEITVYDGVRDFLRELAEGK